MQEGGINLDDVDITSVNLMELSTQSEASVAEPPTKTPEKSSQPKEMNKMEVNVFTAGANGNFITAIILARQSQDFNLSLTDESGYTLVHYAANTANTQALREFLKKDPQCLTLKSTKGQDPLMVALDKNNPVMLKYFAGKLNLADEVIQDSWGFTYLTYSIKNNFFGGFIYLIARGYPLRLDVLDSLKSNYANWACFADRKTILEILFRGEINFQNEDHTGKTPWDHAVSNWSIFSLNFMMDYTHRPLKTSYYLKGKDSNFIEYAIVPANPQVSPETLNSKTISRCLNRIKLYQKGAFDSVASFISSGHLSSTGTFISHFWNKHNISGKFWLYVYLFIVVYLVSYLWYVSGSSVPAATDSQATNEQSSPVAVPISMLDLILILIASSATFATAYSFGKQITLTTGSTLPTAKHFEFYKASKSTTSSESLKLESSGPRTIHKPAFSDYYLYGQEYTDYLEMYGLRRCLYEHVHQIFERQEWQQLQDLTQASICGICGIIKGPKVWHCKQINLCVPKYHKYSKFFDQPVYFANEAKYLLLLMLEAFSLILYWSVILKVVPDNALKQDSLLSVFEKLWIFSTAFGHPSMVLHLAVVGYTLLVKCFNLLLMIYCVLCNLTVDEVMSLPNYPYLLAPDENSEQDEYRFVNAASRGVLGNIRLFVRQISSTYPLID